MTKTDKDVESEENIVCLKRPKLNELESVILDVFIELALKCEADPADNLVIVEVSELLRLCNVERENEDKYTLNKIKEVLKKESNLFKPLFYEDEKRFIVKNHIKSFEWDDDKIIVVEIDRLIFRGRPPSLTQPLPEKEKVWKWEKVKKRGIN